MTHSFPTRRSSDLRFKAVGNRYGGHSLQGIGQSAVEREARELSSVAADILEAPSGIRCMSVVGRKRCLDQWVSPADPRIEKGHIARVGGEVVGAALQEVLRPAGLFDNFERIEEVGGYRRDRKSTSLHSSH